MKNDINNKNTMQTRESKVMNKAEIQSTFAPDREFAPRLGGFADTHAHLTDGAFHDEVEDVILKAKANGVDFIITSGYDLKSSAEAVRLAEKFENVYASIGFYPENCMEYDEKSLKNLVKSKKVVAIGEIGLQYTENMPGREDRGLRYRLFIEYHAFFEHPRFYHVQVQLL